MKKKGLLISTIVMVVVLVASLTTATYAWFTTTSSTTVSGFDVSVTANNVLNIGLKSNNTYDANASADAFVSGSCTYTNTTAGALAGNWTGDPGMAPTVEHNIIFGNVSSAVGVSTQSTVDAVTADNAGVFDATHTGIIFTANKSGTGIGPATAAVPNRRPGDTADTAGDLAYLFLGATPTKAIKSGTNNLYIVVQSSGTGTTVGIASAIHVAYRLNGEQDWHDIDVFGDTHYTALRNNLQETVPVDVTGSEITGNWSPDSKVSTLTGAAVAEIALTQDLAIGAIDQIEIVIYLAGVDSDCIDAAKGVTANIGIFFGAQEDDSTPAA